MKRLFLILLILYPIFSFSQETEKLRQLESKVLELPDGNEKVDVLNQLVFMYAFLKPEKTAPTIQEALDLSKKVKYKMGEAYAYSMRGNLLRIAGYYEEAISDQLYSLELNKDIDNIYGIAINYANLGMIQHEQNNYYEAVKYFKKSMELKLKTADSLSVEFSLNDIANTYADLGQTDSALLYCSFALDRARKSKNIAGQSHANYTIAKIRALDEDYERALHDALISQRQSIESENRYIEIKVKNLIGDIYLNLDDADSAIHYNRMSLDMAREIKNANSIKDASKSLSRAYEKKGDYENALEFQKQYLLFKDSIFNVEKERRIALIESKYDYDTREQLIKAEYEFELKKQRTYFMIIGGALFFFILFGVLIIRKNSQLNKSFTKIQEANEEINNQKDEIISQKEKIHVQASNLIQANAAKDKVFSIIAHDLRGPIENLKGLLELFHSNEISENNLKEFSKDINKKVGGLSTTMNNLLFWSRTQMGGLTAEKSDFELTPIISDKKELFAGMIEEKGLSFRVEKLTDKKAFADINHMRLILRNLISNAIKFSKRGGEILLKVQDENDKIKFCICDKGIGMEAEEVNLIMDKSRHFSKYGTDGEKGTGLGLMLIKELLDINNGELSVQSEKNKGSVFSFTLPSA